MNKNNVIIWSIIILSLIVFVFFTVVGMSNGLLLEGLLYMCLGACVGMSDTLVRRRWPQYNTPLAVAIILAGIAGIAIRGRLTSDYGITNAIYLLCAMGLSIIVYGTFRLLLVKREGNGPKGA